MKKTLVFLFVFSLALSVSSAVLAQAPSTGIISDPLDADVLGEQGAITDTASLVSIILGLVQWVAWFVGLMAVLMGLYSGVLFITASGDAEKLTKARNILLYAIVGIAVAILAFSLVAISKSIIGL